MAIRLITGVPGAGKTYYIVNHILENYCQKFGDTYELKSDYLLITNVDELMLDTVSLDDAIKDCESLEDFFSVVFQEKISRKYEDKKIIYIIDECQKYFHRRYYQRPVFEFFEYHRHMGFDIFLLSQNANLISKDIIGLSEIEVRAVPRTLTIASFMYLKKSNKEIIGRVLLRRKKSVFGMYKSMSKSETEKIKSPYLKYIIPVIFLIIFGMYGLKKSFFGRAIAGASEKTEINEKNLQEKEKLKDSSSYLRSSDFDEAKLQFEKKYVKISYYKKGSFYILYDIETNMFYSEKFFPVPVKKILSRNNKIIFLAEYNVNIEKR